MPRAGAATPLGPLHGVPVTVKVNVDQAGRATTNGVVAFKDNIATEDSPVVANLRRAGAVMIGRTNTPAFSVRWFTDNALHGRTLNPWSRPTRRAGPAAAHRRRWPPAWAPSPMATTWPGRCATRPTAPAWCGLRPSFGRVPAFLPSATEERRCRWRMMSVQGPLARKWPMCGWRCRDERRRCARPLVGARPADRAAPAAPAARGHDGQLPGPPADPAVVAAVRQAGAWLADAGYVVEEVEPPSLAEAHELWNLMGNDEARPLHVGAIERPRRRRRAALVRLDARRTPVLDHTAHLRGAGQAVHADAALAAVPGALPAGAVPGVRRAALPLGHGCGQRRTMARVLRAQESQFAVPVLGLPAVSVPTGMAGPVPMGVQIIGPRFREDLVLDAAEVIEARSRR
jgi:amidase